jgi:hypothetical protein
MSSHPQIMSAVEQLGYRVTCGSVAMQSGINIELARSGLLTLANDTGGHLQVTDTGEIIYDLPRNFRQILARKYWQFQVQQWSAAAWQVVSFLVKRSFGVILITSIGVVYLAILAIVISAACSSEGNCDVGSCVLDCGPSSGGGSGSSSYEEKSKKVQKKRLNFLEAVFSFIFGDGDPNADLERRRWNYIGKFIHQQQGAVIAEQIAPFLDDLGRGFDFEYERYMLPVLTKFNGVPEVSPNGQLVYHFPDLQVKLTSEVDADNDDRIPVCLQERRWKFSKANSSQIKGAIALGVTNIVGIIILALLLSGGGLSGSIGIGLSILTIYGLGFLAIPSVRYFLVKKFDRRVKRRNRSRLQAVNLIALNPAIDEKLAFASQFASQRQISPDRIIYSTDTDALDTPNFLGSIDDSSDRD